MSLEASAGMFLFRAPYFGATLPAPVSGEAYPDRVPDNSDNPEKPKDGGAATKSAVLLLCECRVQGENFGRRCPMTPKSMEVRNWRRAVIMLAFRGVKRG